MLTYAQLNAIIDMTLSNEFAALHESVVSKLIEAYNGYNELDTDELEQRVRDFIKEHLATVLNVNDANLVEQLECMITNEDFNCQYNSTFADYKEHNPIVKYDTLRDIVVEYGEFDY